MEEKKSAAKQPITRDLKIYSQGRTRKDDSKDFPQIRLWGNWLLKLGFQQGQMVRITATHGKLVIQHRPE